MLYNFISDSEMLKNAHHFVVETDSAGKRIDVDTLFNCQDGKASLSQQRSESRSDRTKSYDNYIVIVSCSLKATHASTPLAYP
jgi:hypothetical protein